MVKAVLTDLDLNNNDILNSNLSGGGGGGGGTSWTSIDPALLATNWNDVDVDTTNSEVYYRHDGQSLKFRATYRVTSLNAAALIQPLDTFTSLITQLGLTFNPQLWGKGNDATEILVHKYASITFYDSSIAGSTNATIGGGCLF